MMLANFFGKSKPVNFIIIGALFLIYFLIAQFTVVEGVEKEVLTLPKLLMFLLFALFLFLFNFIIIKNKLTRDNLYAFLLLIIFLGTISNTLVNANNLLVEVLILFALRKIYSIRKPNNILAKLFDAGLWLGVAFILEPFSLVFFLMIYAAVFLFYEISVRTLLIPILGMLSPIFLFFTYSFFVDRMTYFNSLFEFTTSYDFSSYNTAFYKLSLAFISLILLISILARTPKIFSVNNKFKRSWALLLFHLIVATGFVLLLKKRDGAELMAIFIPITIILANWLQFVKRKWMIDFVLLLFLGYSISVHFIV